MRIGYDAKRAFLNFSGLGNYSRNIISLVNRYYPSDEIVIYTPKIRKSIPGFPPPGSVVRQPESMLARRFSSVWRSAGLSARLTRDGIDLYHGLSNELPLRIAKTNIPAVVTIHDLIFIRYPELYNPIDRKIYSNKLRYAVKAARKIIAISEQTKSDIIDFTGIAAEKVCVIYQSCSPAFTENVSRQFMDAIRKKYEIPERYMLYVGTIEKRKNLLSIRKSHT